MPPRKNYTEREKRELLAVVNKYKSILENKSTNAVSVEKKNEAWEKVALEFNAGAEFPRTAKQLNVAYQNLKRITRQQLAEKNMKDYILKKEELGQFKKDHAHDKKAVKVTGGGTFTPALSEVGAQMLALMGNQLKPLSNDCDSASEYYRVDEDLVDAETIIDISPEPSHQPVEYVVIQEIDEPAPPQVRARADAVKGRRLQGSRPKEQKKRFEQTIEIKRKFYKKKLECALIEKKIKLASYKLALKNQKLLDLEIKIKEIQYSELLKNNFF